MVYLCVRVCVIVYCVVPVLPCGMPFHKFQFHQQTFSDRCVPLCDFPLRSSLFSFFFFFFPYSHFIVFRYTIAAARLLLVWQCTVLQMACSTAIPFNSIRFDSFDSRFTQSIRRILSYFASVPSVTTAASKWTIRCSGGLFAKTSNI